MRHKNFNESHYKLGVLFLYVSIISAFELYQQFSGSLEGCLICLEHLKYDAINLCMNDAKYGCKVTTLMVFPKGAQSRVGFKTGNAQYHPDYPHLSYKKKNRFVHFTLN